MEIFRQLISLLSAVPAWVPLIVCPAFVIVAAVLFTVLGGRRAYPCLAAAIGAAGLALTGCIGTPAEALVYGAGYALLASLLGLLFLLPVPRRKEKFSSRDERIYEQFRGEPLRADFMQEAPVKECCFDAQVQEEAPELAHATALLGKLQKCKLSSADRLEADALARTLSALKGRALTLDEQNTLNDCLASVLKLTAKYKL